MKLYWQPLLGNHFFIISRENNVTDHLRAISRTYLVNVIKKCYSHPYIYVKCVI